MATSITTLRFAVEIPTVDMDESVIFRYVEETLTAQPETAKLIRELIDYPVHSLRDNGEVLCLRSQDVLTTLLQFCQGKMLASDSTNVGAQVISKGHEGNIWTTANFANPAFDANGALENYLPSLAKRSFTQAINNNADYGSQISFGTAILRNLVPQYFPPDWIKKAHKILFGSARVSDLNSTPGEVSEGTFSFLHEYCSYLKQGLNGWVGSYGDALLKAMLPEKPPRQEFIDRMMQYHEQRSGVQIFFKNGLLRYVDRVYTEDVAFLLPPEDSFECTADELVIDPKNGYIPLNTETVLAILPLGDYEFDVLERLGLSL